MCNDYIGTFNPAIEFKTVHLNPGDIIIMTVDPELVHMDEAADIFQMLHDSFPNNTTIGVVKGIDLEIIEHIDKAIQRLEEIKNDMVC